MSWHAHMGHITAAFTAVHAPTRRTIQLGDHPLDVLVAETPTQWKVGMRDQPTDVDGMLFVMPPGSTLAFHMAGIDHPLGIAFFDDEGRVTEIGYMDAHTGTYAPTKPYTYALEFRDPHVVAHLGQRLVLS